MAGDQFLHLGITEVEQFGMLDASDKEGEQSTTLGSTLGKHSRREENAKNAFPFDGRNKGTESNIVASIGITHSHIDLHHRGIDQTGYRLHALLVDKWQQSWQTVCATGGDNIATSDGTLLSVRIQKTGLPTTIGRADTDLRSP